MKWPRRRAVWAAAALALMQAVLLLRTAWDKSDTGDEPVYIGAAALLWAHRDFAYNNPAPVLPKWGYAVALRLVDPWIATAPDDWGTVISHMLWARRTERLRLNLFAARCATIAVTVMGGLLLWAAARRFGERAALVTQALWCVSPSILANGSLATLDGWLAAVMCLVLWTGVRLFERPTLRRFWESGAALGLALGCKVTALGVAPVLAAVGIVALRRQGKTGRAFWTAAAERTANLAGAAFLVLWSLYGLTVGPVTTEPLAERFGWTARTFGPLPFPAWISGLLHQWALSEAGHRTLPVRPRSPRTAGGGSTWPRWPSRPPSARRRWRWRASSPASRSRPARADLMIDAALLAYPLMLLVLMSQAATQTGIRYLLPAFPFVMVWLGRALPTRGDAFGPSGRSRRARVRAAGGGGVAVRPPAPPDVLQPLGGRARGRPALHDPGRRLGPGPAPPGRVDPRSQPPWRSSTPSTTASRARWGIESGTAAVHADGRATTRSRPSRFTGRSASRPGCLDWLTVEPPDERIGYSIYIYQVNKERARAARRRARHRGAVLAQRRSAARQRAMSDGSRVRRLLPNVALAGAVVVALLATGELFARWARARRGGGREDNALARYSEFDPRLGWRKKPGAHATYRRREYTVDVDINGQGLRDPERPYAAAPGTFRMLALGDSFVEGYTVAARADRDAADGARALAAGLRGGRSQRRHRRLQHRPGVPLLPAGRRALLAAPWCSSSSITTTSC